VEMRRLLVLLSLTVGVPFPNRFTSACDDHIFNNMPTDYRTNVAVKDQRHLDGSYDTEVCAFQPNLSEEEMKIDEMNMATWRIRERSKSVFERAIRMYTIPVYFHVIQTTQTTGIVSDTRIREFVDYLNESYSNSSVPFTFEYMAVTRTVRADWDKCNNASTAKELKTALKVGGSDTLNVYICNPMFTEKGASITGYSTGPESSTSILDGIVINNESGDRRLNTLVHESVRTEYRTVKQR
jgi:hypothetical protein